VKVCLVLDTFPGMHARWSGAERMAQRLGEHLTARGHAVTCLTRPPDAGLPAAPDALCVRQGLPQLGWVTRHLPVDLPAMASALAHLRRLRPDIVHSHAKDLHFPMLAACRVLGIPVVFTVVDQYLFCPTQTLALPDGEPCGAAQGRACEQCFRLVEDHIASPFLRASARCSGAVAALLGLRAVVAGWSARRLGAVIALSETSRRRVIGLGVAPERVHRVYQYDVDQPRDEPKPYPDPTVVYVGALSAARGAHVAVRVFDRVLRQLPSARLKMIGGVWDDFGRTVQSLPSELGIADRVEFLGQLPNARTLEVIRRSHVVLVPLQFPNEFGPMNMVEAMRLGRPVVAGRIGATHEFVRDGVDGVLVPYDDVEAYAARAVALLRDPAMASVMGEMGRRSSVTASEGHYADAILSVYRKLVQERSRAR